MNRPEPGDHARVPAGYRSGRPNLLAGVPSTRDPRPPRPGTTVLVPGGVAEALERAGRPDAHEVERRRSR